MKYELHDRIALLSIDDGKANVVGHALLDAINAALDRAENEEAGAVILRGRDGVFSGGFDLKEFTTADDAGFSMVKRGMQLLIRLYGYPLPVVAIVTGHAVAMGAFLVLTCDTRIGARGSYKVTLPETALGMELPATMIELSASRISPRFITRAMIQAEVFDPELAVTAGFFDEVSDSSSIDEKGFDEALKLAQLPAQQYAGNKLLARKHVLASMQEAYDQMTVRFE
ncbi:MAG: crotonase/enoyl-CoA hydratase family protein [Halioglobus sp.]|nr:crotonase/enoyl-CoA hydratase family protein [Halioglobus sp.]